VLFYAGKLLTNNVVWYNSGNKASGNSTDDTQGRLPEEMVKLNAIHNKATTVLMTCRTLFPFDLFPNTLIIDYNKIDIIYRTFFRTSRTMSIPIARLNHVTVNSTFFLSTLEIDVRGFEHKPQPLSFLRTVDAHRAKDLLFGLMSAYASKIDLTRLPLQESMEKLIDIGRSASRNKAR
ncbi:MAG TPA: hypothetical protein VNG32_00040, partial [Candidatus Dormibacteraeota bacterium]|nr:hypothetical protein [Candidatus Dormibacteraeota bacterium]